MTLLDPPAQSPSLGLGQGQPGAEDPVRHLDAASLVRPPTPRPPAPRSWPSGFLLHQLVLLGAAVAVYFGVRHLTEGSEVAAHQNARLLIDLERALGVFVELDLQTWALGYGGVLEVVNAIYIWGHWPVIVAVLGWLAWRHREVFVVYRNALLLSGLVGMVIVAFFPVAPPRLMDLGFVDTVVAHSDSYRVMQPTSLTNQYAAMPSFHVGWDLLVGLALVRVASRRWVRIVGATLPALMLVSVVVTGNHYLVDAVVGDAIVLASLWCAVQWQRRAEQSGQPLTLGWFRERRTG